MHQIFTKLNMKRACAVIMAVVMMLALNVPCVAAETSGECGSGVTWSYADGTLTISGSGAMANYTAKQPAPWDAFRESLRVVNIEDGVTTVGNYAFHGFSLLTSVVFPNSVGTIGDFAFADCTGLKMLNLGAGLRIIGESAFENCTNLQSVRLPEGLTALGRKAFSRCSGLRSVVVPSSVTTMGSMAFARCNGLLIADVNAAVETLPIWTFYSCDALARVTLSADIHSVGSKAFYLCNNLTEVYYAGNESDGAAILSAIQAHLPEFMPDFLKYTKKVDAKAEAVTGYIEQNKIVSESVTVNDTPNANISTTVTTTIPIEGTEEAPVLGDQQTAIKIDAVIDTAEGWSELVKQIEENVQKAAKETNESLKVNVTVNHDETIEKETLSPIAGQDVTLTVETKDGSAYRIDCSNLEEEKLEDGYELTYTLSANTTPTQKQKSVFGDATSFLLNFNSNATISYSPRIYLGTEYAHECAVMYQQIRGRKIERVQSAIIDKEGYATFYLGQTLSAVQYFIAIGVENETYADAIIPDELSVDMESIAMYEPIQYVVTGERIFMGLNLGQFSYVLFGGLVALFVVIGTVMAIFYRKKRLELLYRLKRENQE